MEKGKLIHFIAKNTDDYLQIQGRTLDERLGDISLTMESEKDIVIKETGKTVIEAGLGLLGGLGTAITTIMNWNEDVNNELSEAKKMILLEQYFNKSDNQQRSLENLKSFLTNPQGITLFNKILRLLDDSPPDEELMSHLSTVLKVIVSAENFELLFEQHKFALAQIERLTPQALTIIADHKSWPNVNLGMSVAHGPKITSDWHTEFTNAYCKLKGVTDENKFKRVGHSVYELQRLGIMEAFNSSQNHNRVECRLTLIGSDLLPYIS